MKLKHIDNSFYRLSEAQARQIAGRLPRFGWEITIKPSSLPDIVLLHPCRSLSDGLEWIDVGINAKEARSVEVKRTPLSWHDGKAIKRGWVWAIHLYFSM